MLSWLHRFVSEAQEKWRKESREHRSALRFILLIAVVLRVSTLANGAHLDERVTFDKFVRQPWSVVVSSYPEPNNHVFHSLLAKLSVTVFGGSLWALRLPALIAGVLIVPAAYIASRLLYGSAAALLATAIVSTSSELVAYSGLARGYSLITLCFLALIIMAIRLKRDSAVAGWALFAVLAALGLWTIPVMLFPLGAVSLWFAMASVSDRRSAAIGHLAVALAGAAALTALLYTPIISHEGVSVLTRNGFVTPSSWASFFDELAINAIACWRAWWWKLPTLLIVAVATTASIAVMQHRQLSRHRIGIAHTAITWSLIVLFANHRMPPARVWQWLVPICAALAGAGIRWSLGAWRPTAALAERGLVAAALATVGGVALLLPSF